MDDRDWAVLERLQEGFPLVPLPFTEMAENIGMAAEEFLQRVNRLHDEGAIRRIGPRVRHHRVGIAGNIMVVWRVPTERQNEVGELFAADEHVSHCYVRPAFAGFPYTLYTMVHGPDTAAVEQTVAHLATQAGLSDYLLLPTVRELKKTSPRYHRPQEGQP
jgi:siroheme decarboxylase